MSGTRGILVERIGSGILFKFTFLHLESVGIWALLFSTYFLALFLIYFIMISPLFYPYPLGKTFASIENFFLYMNGYYYNFFPKLSKENPELGLFPLYEWILLQFLPKTSQGKS
jgi:hypothetical protein